MEKLEGWRAALREVADLGGMVLQNQTNGHEAKFIQEIVEVIGNKLNCKILNAAPHPVGLESQVKDINRWLQDGAIDVGVAVFHGMGGIGKTTIAKILYNLNFDRFEGSSFLENIREASEQPNGVIRLQRQLLSNIIKGKKRKIYSIDEGISKVRDAICCKRVLVFLDDVDRVDQLNAIIGKLEWFCSGSKIIITTRYQPLLKSLETYKMYEIKKLDNDESLQLFSWYAFGQGHPVEGYLEQSRSIVQYCGGLPLALQVLGSSLFGKSAYTWESALQKLRAIPDSKIQKILKISYDSLQDDHDKNLFLDIACFFIGKDKDYTIEILDKCDFFPAIGIQNLIDRCLLTINEHKKLMMHQLLRDMGKEIVRQESPKEPGKRSRLWHHKDSFNILREKTGTETIEGLILDIHPLKLDMPRKKLNIAQYHFEDFVDKSTVICDRNSRKRCHQGLFSWLPKNSTLTESDEADLKTEAFSCMHKIRILQLYNVRLTGCYEEFPKKLRWLCWHGFPLKFIPHNFPLENLVVLDMRNSSLGHLWKGTKMLRLLKILNLSHSHALASSPNFSQFPNLEKLILKDCINLVGLHESIRGLQRLVLLNLRGCKNLRKLPRGIVQLKSLKKLVLSDCPRIGKLPPDLGKMESSKVLQADGINELSSTTGESKRWHKLVWFWVSKPRSNPESICFSLTSLPHSLVHLYLANCSLSNDSIPANLGTLSSLQTLDLSGNPICSLPGSVKCLTRLQELELSFCTRLQTLPELPMSLKLVFVHKCKSLATITFLPNLLQELFLNMYGCEKLVEVQGVWKLEPVGNINSEMITYLGLAELDSMRMLEVKLYNYINGCANIKTAPGLQVLYECGIYSIFLPRSEIPGWFNKKCRGSSISFTIPSLPNLKIRGLYICVVYALALGAMCNACIRVNNKTRDLKWAYYPIIHGIPDEDKDMAWLSDWKTANMLMEGGDEVNVSVIMGDYFKVKEVGTQILYDDEEEEKGTQSNTSYPNCHQTNVIDLSVYQRSEGEYLCNGSSISTDVHYRAYSMMGGSQWTLQ